eukprot:TRINITY_DN3378_c0_g1_i1.p1 TRINITY_DN3378_c0_g1~~TRINITY_DN3378_c0_g1_i1.p1  ORF type:complete len:343 (-),score=40.40 TRINITY_DN3378_c0_g1_i1:189-1217(-)
MKNILGKDFSNELDFSSLLNKINEYIIVIDNMHVMMDKVEQMGNIFLFLQQLATKGYVIVSGSNNIIYHLDPMNNDSMKNICLRFFDISTITANIDNNDNERIIRHYLCVDKYKLKDVTNSLPWIIHCQNSFLFQVAPLILNGTVDPVDFHISSVINSIEFDVRSALNLYILGSFERPKKLKNRTINALLRKYRNIHTFYIVKDPYIRIYLLVKKYSKVNMNTLPTIPWHIYILFMPLLSILSEDVVFDENSYYSAPVMEECSIYFGNLEPLKNFMNQYIGLLDSNDDLLTNLAILFLNFIELMDVDNMTLLNRLVVEYFGSVSNADRMLMEVNSHLRWKYH